MNDNRKTKKNEDHQLLKRLIDNKKESKRVGSTIKDTITVYKFAYREVLLYNGYTEEQANTVEQLVNDMVTFLDGGESYE